MSSSIRRRITRTLLTATMGLTLAAGSAAAQTAFEPRVVEFLPASRAAAAITRYDLEIAVAGSAQPLQRMSLGLLPVDADGLGRVNVAAALTATPVAGVAYAARILAVGPTGTTVSAASNPFTFRRATPPAAAPVPDAAHPQTVQVASEPALQAAIAALTSHTTIVLAPGRYRLSATLRIAGPLDGVVLMGSTGRASDVVLEGAGMTAAGPAPTAVAVSGRVLGLTIADLTIRRFAAHALTFADGPQAPRLTNLHLADTGAALVTVAAGVDDGLVEHASFNHATTGAPVTGLDLQGVRGWTVRRSAFHQIRGVAVAAHAGSADTIVTENLFVDCGRGVAFGLVNVPDGVDHTGGRITDNRVTRAATVAGGPGVSILDSPRTVIARNTIFTAQTAAPIEYRFADSIDLIVADNLTDGPLRARDGAWALETGNDTAAAADGN